MSKSEGEEMTDERCPNDPAHGYVGECEIGQYGLCNWCLKGEYQSMGYGPQSSRGTPNE